MIMENKAAQQAVPEKKKKMNKKKKQQLIHQWIRFGIQAVFFFWFPAAFTSGFSGVKYIFTQMGTGAVIERSTFLTAFIVLCAYTVVFGRFFCGFACAFGAFGDWVHTVYIWICKKIKKKPLTIPQKITSKINWVKYAMLALIALLCYLEVFSNLHGMSPWEVFSMFTVRNLQLAGYAAGSILLIFIIAGMCLQERFFCRFLCPLGAVFSILPVLPLFSLRRDRENCIGGCSACTRQCPSDIELSAKGAWENAGDCFQCQKCIDTCPKGNISTGISKIRGNEIVFTIIRAAALAAVFLLIGI